MIWFYTERILIYQTVPIADKCIFKIVGYRINTQKPAAFLSTNDKQNKKRN